MVTWSVKYGSQTGGAAAVAMLTGPARSLSPSGPSELLAGRAYTNGILTFAKGSNENMGFWNILTDTNLYRDGNIFRIGTCPGQ